MCFSDDTRKQRLARLCRREPTALSGCYTLFLSAGRIPLQNIYQNLACCGRLKASFRPSIGLLNYLTSTAATLRRRQICLPHASLRHSAASGLPKLLVFFQVKRPRQRGAHTFEKSWQTKGSQTLCKVLAADHTVSAKVPRRTLGDVDLWRTRC